MKIKVTNLQNEEVYIDVANISDVEIEKDNGQFKQLTMLDLEEDLGYEQLEHFDNDDIKDYVVDDFEAFKFEPSVICTFKIEQVVKCIIDDFKLEPDILVSYYEEEKRLEWKRVNFEVEA